MLTITRYGPGKEVLNGVETEYISKTIIDQGKLGVGRVYVLPPDDRSEEAAAAGRKRVQKVAAEVARSILARGGNI